MVYDKSVIEKLAEYVAQTNGTMEATVRERQRGNAQFAFLFGGEGADYYKECLQRFSSGNGSSGPAGAQFDGGGGMPMGGGPGNPPGRPGGGGQGFGGMGGGMAGGGMGGGGMCGGGAMGGGGMGGGGAMGPRASMPSRLPHRTRARTLKVTPTIVVPVLRARGAPMPLLSSILFRRALSKLKPPRPSASSSGTSAGIVARV